MSEEGRKAMKIVQTDIYICEFCNRKMFGKGSMSLHEKQCKENPKNKHICFSWCKHLEKGFNQENSEVTFTCNVKNTSLFSYKLERFSCHKDRIKDLTSMPLECDLYERYYAEAGDSAFDIFEFNF